MRLCSADGCVNKHYAKGYCFNHYNGLKRQGLIGKGKCAVNECNLFVYAKGFCFRHLRNYKIHGTPDKKICQAPGCNNTIHFDSVFCIKHRYRGERGIDFDLPDHFNMTGSTNPKWKGGVAEYPNHAEFKRQRKIKLESTGYKCEHCGSTATLVHHKDKTKTNHSLDNLESICRSCHCKTFKKKVTKFVKIYGMTAKEIGKKLNYSQPYIVFLHVKKRLAKLLK